MKARSEDAAPYGVKVDTYEDDTIKLALDFLHARIHNPTNLSSPTDVRNFLLLKMQGLEHEEFGCLWMNAQNRLIKVEDIFRGTLTQTSVYPREIVKAALACNAAACILYHNHPSGVAEPSRADEALTTSLKSALALVDIRVLDHIIVAGATSVSLAERGAL